MSEIGIFRQSWSPHGKMVKKQMENVAQPENAPEYLQRYSKEHLLYEVQMFFQVGHLLMTGHFQTSQPEVAIVLHNAIMESFVLHLRNLLDFFYTAPRKTDVSATMFYDSGHLPPDFPAESTILSAAHRRAHKEMSHITTERHWEGNPAKLWEFHRLLREVKPLVEKFLQTASAARLHPDFIQQTKLLLTIAG
jgi:hypothetical protein